MNTKQAQDVVLLEAVAIGLITVLGSLGSGKGLPKAPSFAAVGLLAGGLMILARVNARTAVTLGGIAVAGAALASYTSGKSLAEAAFDQVSRIGKAGSSPTPGETATEKYAKLGAAATATAGASDDVASSVVDSAGGAKATGGRPVIGSYRIIGYPGGDGTHSFSKPPHNWESDNALDIATPVGTPVYAIADGTIGDRIGYLGSAGDAGRFAGQRVNLFHADGGRSYYAHLSRINVRAGQKVKKGEMLGVSGTANGVPHLHFAVMPPAKPQTYYGG